MEELLQQDNLELLFSQKAVMVVLVQQQKFQDLQQLMLAEAAVEATVHNQVQVELVVVQVELAVVEQVQENKTLLEPFLEQPILVVEVEVVHKLILLEVVEIVAVVVQV